MSTDWHILGAGSLATLWAGRLLQAGQSVQLILRSPERIQALQHRGGLELIDNTICQKYSVDAQLPEHPEPIRKLILACKAYDAESAILPLRPRLKGAEVLLLQNGLGSQEAVTALLPESRCFFISSTEGAHRTGDFQVVWAGKGQNWMGSPNNSTPPEWLPLLDAAQIPYQWTAQIQDKLWRKLAINCAINPLTVLHNCPNGQLLEHTADWQPLCDELEQLLCQAGHPDAALHLQPEVSRILTATAQNRSSMLQDVQRKQRTEIHYLLGYACRTAHSLNLATPHLSALYQALRTTLQRLGLPDT